MARSWPLLQCLVDFTNGPPLLPRAPSIDLLSPTTPVAFRGFSTNRGRQYELGTVQAGGLSLNIDDPSEYLNPVNSGSPWNSGANTLLPYRCVQVGAWWRQSTQDTTGNLLNSTNEAYLSTSSYDPSFESGTSVFFTQAGSPSFTTSTAQHFVGAQSLACTFTGATDNVALGCVGPANRVQTLSVYVFVPAGHTATLRWSAYTPAGVGSTIGTATSSLTGTWQRLVVTGTPSGPVTLLQVLCSAAYPATVYVDAFQLELGGAASAFTTAGPTFFPVYTGYVERYPQEWADKGFRGVKPLEAVDALSPLSRTIISQTYASTIAADGPSLFIPYNDDGFPQQVQRPLGGQQPIPYQQIGSQSASINFGGDSFLDGSKALSISQQNTDPVTIQTDTTQVSYVGTRNGPLSVKPAGYTLEMWVKFTSGQAYFGLASMLAGETTVGKPDGPDKFWGFYSSFGRLTTVLFDPNGGSTPVLGFSPAAPWNGYPDGKWHYISLVLTGGTSMYNVVDTRYSPTPYTLLFTPSNSIAMDNFFVNATSYFGDPVSTIAIANLAAYPTALTPTQAAAHYQRGIGYFGEMSGARALRLLTQYWSSSVVTDTGKTSMAEDFSYNGRSMLDVLQEIADTEAGLVWADAGGFVHQDSRETRYTVATSTTSQFTFGENTAGGELPYTDLKYDYDPTYVYSQANFTAGGSGTTLPPVVNPTTQAAVGQRVLSKTLQMAVDWDVLEAAKFYAGRYAKPAGAPGTGVPPRIAGMTIDPSSNPDLWTAALSLDVGWRVTVKRRTAAGVTISGDYYIEQVNHSNNGEKWTVQYQLSPVFVSQPWILGDAVKGVLGTTTVCVY